MLKRCFICLSIILLGYVASAAANPRNYPEFAQQKVTDDIPIQFVTAETVKQRIDDAGAQRIIDVRNPSSYHKSHLPGALSIPLRTLPERVAEVPRDIPVVLYWACPHHLASLAYQYLYRLGYRNMQVLKEGLPGWEKRHYPTGGAAKLSALR